jgi:hypothetical protein
MSCGFDEMGHDRSVERARNARLQAERAVKLAPDSDYARFALGFAMCNDGVSEAEGLGLLRKQIERHPQDKFMLRTLGRQLAVPGVGRDPANFVGDTRQEGLAYLVRAAALPGGDPIAEFIRGQALHRTPPYRFAEALAAFDRALALAPEYADAYMDKLEVLLEKLGDPEAARTVVEKLPPAVALGETKLAEATAELAGQLAGETRQTGSVFVGQNITRVLIQSPEEGARIMAELLSHATPHRTASSPPSICCSLRSWIRSGPTRGSPPPSKRRRRSTRSNGGPLRRRHEPH